MKQFGNRNFNFDAIKAKLEFIRENNIIFLDSELEEVLTKLPAKNTEKEYGRIRHHSSEG